MRRGLTIFLTGVVVGSISTYLFEKKREKLLKKINELEFKLKNLQIKESLKLNIGNILSKLKFTLKNDENLTEVEKDMILKEVKEKIKQIEEWNLR